MYLSRIKTDSDNRSPIPLKSATETRLSNLVRVSDETAEAIVALRAVIENPLESNGFGRTQGIRCSFQDDFKSKLIDVIHRRVMHFW